MEKENYYKYVNKSWLDDTSIPSHSTSWSNFNILAEENQKKLYSLIKNDKGVVGGIVKLYDNRNSMDGLRDLMDRTIDCKKLRNCKGGGKLRVFELFGKLNRLGVDSPIYAGVGRDQKEPIYALDICQSGLTLPSVEYYDKYSDELEDFFGRLIAKSSRLWKFKSKPIDIVSFEKQIANLHLKPEERRDVLATYNPMKLNKLSREMKQMVYGFGIRLNDETLDLKCCVESPAYLDGIIKCIENVSIDTIIDYAALQIIMGFANLCGKKFQKVFFDFFSKTLRGQVKEKALWKKRVGIVGSLAGDSLGELYRKQYFPSNDRKVVVGMIENIKVELAKSIQNSTWMKGGTKKKALHKLDKMNMKIGYPMKPNRRKSTDIKTTLLETVQHLRNKEFLRMKRKWVKRLPIEKKWYMKCYEVNAYYSPQDNEIVFPAGILQAPYYDPKQTAAQNFAGIGAIVGHEITHGFDDQGCRYDADGKLSMWWSDEDFKNYTKRTKVIERQFNAHTIDGMAINGALTLGENIADIGGFNLAYSAYTTSHDCSDAEKKDFMKHWALIWRNKRTKQSLEEQVLTDPHSPGEARVNGVLSTISDFYKLYNINKDNKMYLNPKLRTSIW
jgi:putative endopeptidase